jgi:hypothetical protein
MPVLRGIINRILATGQAGVEFLPAGAIALKSFKPLIAITSLAKRLGKSQVGRYITHALSDRGKRVAIILPIPDIVPQQSPFRLESGPHFAFTKKDPQPNEVLGEENRRDVMEYLRAGADIIFVTSDIRRAIISSEQRADVIILDAKRCDTPCVSTDHKFCVVTPTVVANVRQVSEWPGLTNLHIALNVIVLTTNGEQLDRRVLEPMVGRNHRFFYAQQFTDANESAVVVEHEVEQGIAPSSDPELLTRLPRGAANREMARLASRADVVVSLHRELTGIDPHKKVVYATHEFSDTQGEIQEWLTRTFESQKPPLQEHFSAQVDIILSMVSASDKELFVSNHSSYNREAFCRLFLSSHIPPGFRVTTGEIIDAACNRTGRLDVVVVNDSSPRLTVDATGSIIAPILADTVLAVIEVKTALTAEQLRKALSQLRSVKALMPTHSTLLAQDGRIIGDPLGGKIITGIFAFSRGPDIVARTREIVAQYPGVIDFIVVPDRFGYFSVNTLRVCGISVNEADVVDGYIEYRSRGLSLAILFGILNSLAATRRFSASNYIRYLNGSWATPGETEAMLTERHSEGRIRERRQSLERPGFVEATISEVPERETDQESSDEAH